MNNIPKSWTIDRNGSRFDRLGWNFVQMKDVSSIKQLGPLVGQFRAIQKIGGRDSPHEVFDPCVRWDLGLDRIRSFRVAVVALSRCRVVALSRCRHQDGPFGRKRTSISSRSLRWTFFGYVLDLFFRKVSFMRKKKPLRARTTVDQGV